MRINGRNRNYEKILLGLMPFWDPQIPPLGLSCLKSFLQQHHFNVKIFDLNIKKDFRDIINIYFETLKEYIPDNKRGNYYKIGHDVLMNHMMAHMNFIDERKYIELVRVLIFNTFYTDVTNHQILDLIEIVADFYRKFENYLLDLLTNEKPDLLGLSVFSGNLPASLFAFKLTKERWPNIKTVMGGGIFTDQLNPNSNEFKLFLKKTPFIDAIIIGEGENLFLKYLRNELPGSTRVYSLKTSNSEVLDLSSVDIPDYSDLDIQFYPYLSNYTSRSCPFECSFCSETVMWGKYRKKNISQVVKESKELHKKYKYQLFLFGDSLINPVVNDLSEEFFEAGVSIYWDGYLRVDKNVCNIDNTLLWRKGGLYRARLGVESGSNHVLDLMEKKITPGQIRKALSSLAYAGIKTTTYWVVGHPGETERDFLETLKLIEELKDEIYEADCTPFQYFLAGQSHSKEWLRNNKTMPLYPEDARNMLVVQTWIMDAEPSREETYKRMNIFVEHCEKLGIPNVYSLKDTYNADERWKNIHMNTVPSLVEFSKESDIKENREDRRLFLARKKQLSDINFKF